METLKEALRDGFSCTDKGYVDSYKENIFQHQMPVNFQEMFDNGSGGELRSKAEAVHSSSMLGYNFFHWVPENPLSIDEITYTRVFFEVKMKVFSNTTPANMDILLIGEQNGRTKLLFIESKFLEYLEPRPYKLSDRYKSTPDWSSFLEEVDKLIGKSNCKYKAGIKQGVSHLFALSNLAEDDAFDYFNNENRLNITGIQNEDIRFINLIFEPSTNYDNEHTCFEKYRDLYCDFIDIVEKCNHIKVKPEFLTYTKLWNEIEQQIKDANEDLHQYLYHRYMRYAQV